MGLSEIRGSRIFGEPFVAGCARALDIVGECL